MAGEAGYKENSFQSRAVETIQRIKDAAALIVGGAPGGICDEVDSRNNNPAEIELKTR